MSKVLPAPLVLDEAYPMEDFGFYLVGTVVGVKQRKAQGTGNAFLIVEVLDGRNTVDVMANMEDFEKFLKIKGVAGMFSERVRVGARQGRDGAQVSVGLRSDD